MRILMANQEFLHTTLCTEKLSITEPFQFKPDYRAQYPSVADCTDEPYTPSQPFDSTIKSFKQLCANQSPMAKLELIYSICTSEVMEEISRFWYTHEIDAKKLAIDTDQLQGIVIYIVSRSNYPQIITDAAICELFLPPAVKKSARFLYLEMVKASCEFLAEYDVDESPDELHEQPQVLKPSGASTADSDEFVEFKPRDSRAESIAFQGDQVLSKAEREDFMFMKVQIADVSFSEDVLADEKETQAETLIEKSQQEVSNVFELEVEQEAEM